MNNYSGKKIYLIDDFTLKSAIDRNGKEYHYASARGVDNREFKDRFGEWRNVRPVNYLSLTIYDRRKGDDRPNARLSFLMNAAASELRRGMIVNIDGEAVAKTRRASNGKDYPYLQVEVSDYSFSRGTLYKRNSDKPLPTTPLRTADSDKDTTDNVSDETSDTAETRAN